MNEIKTCVLGKSVTHSPPIVPESSRFPVTGLWGSVEKYRRSLGWALTALLLPFVVFTKSIWPMHEPIHESIEALGLLLIAVSIAGRVYCTLYIGGRKNQVLMRYGPYSVVRNPLYLFSVLGASGVGFSTGSLELGTLSGVTAFLLFSAVIRAEEARLLHRFGDDYRSYLLAVSRWLPDLRRWSDSEVEVVRSALVWRTLRDGFGLLLLVPLVEGVEQVQALGVIPVLLTLR